MKGKKIYGLPSTSKDRGRRTPEGKKKTVGNVNHRMVTGGRMTKEEKGTVEGKKYT